MSILALRAHALFLFLFLPLNAWAAAILIPDQTSRLGSCGAPEGPACTWECGTGKDCSGEGACALYGTQAISVVLSYQIDSAPCGGSSGSALRLGLASTEGTPFQSTEMVFDFCDRDLECTGRSARSCGICSEASDCSSDDGYGNYPCPPGPVVFLCSDPCSGADSFLSQESAFDFAGWLIESFQPVPELLRSQLPGAPAVGRPFIYHAEYPLETNVDPDPPAGRTCVRIAYTAQDRPLSVCSNDTTHLCTADLDCDGGTCEGATPPDINPTEPTTVASTFACAAPGGDTGLPCVTNADCDSNSCTQLPSTGYGYCYGSGAGCDPEPCPDENECDSTLTCPPPSCGDGIVDPGEDCDAGLFGPGNGCDSSCKVESCFSCESVLGRPSDCVSLTSGEPCDRDGTPCTVDTCGSLGTCESGPVQTSCAAACAWMFDPDDTIINGEYMAVSDYYQKTIPQTDEGACGFDFLYIYLANGQWRIGPELGSTTTWIARCNADVFVESPFDCAGDWELAGSAQDVDAVVTDGACPTWPCDSVVVAYESPEVGTECVGTFTRSDVAANVYESVNEATLVPEYFYFNPLTFRWQCGPEIDADCDPSVHEMAADAGFPHIEPLQWIEFSGQDPALPFFVNCLVTTTTTSTTTTTTTSTTATTTSSTTTSTTVPSTGGCGDPAALQAQALHAPSLVTATDALYILNAAVGLVSCEPCVCDVDSSGGLTPTDALRVLRYAVGESVTLTCPACG